MKTIIILLVAMLLHSISVANEGVTIDVAEIQSTGNVVVKPSAEYDVKLEGYTIPKEAELIIFHVLSSSRSAYYYQAITPGQSVYKMTSDNLQSSTGSPPFKGLKHGDSAFLIIGSETQPGSINMGMLYSYESIAIMARE